MKKVHEKGMRDGGAQVPIQPTALYWLRDLRRLFGISDSTVREARRDGLLTVRRAGHAYFVLGSDLLAWLEGLKVGREGPGLLANGNGHPL